MRARQGCCLAIAFVAAALAITPLLLTGGCALIATALNEPVQKMNAAHIERAGVQLEDFQVVDGGRSVAKPEDRLLRISGTVVSVTDEPIETGVILFFEQLHKNNTLSKVQLGVISESDVLSPGERRKFSVVTTMAPTAGTYCYQLRARGGATEYEWEYDAVR
ncbi:MAG: hypothetical protein AAF690_18190 [Acidobacteriota bacterium]